MSQEKVAKYKEQKANRKEIMKKAKKQKMLRSAAAAIVCAAALGWIGYSAVDTIVDNIPRETVEIDYTAIDEYLAGLEE